jgi:hypothetical protein
MATYVGTTTVIFSISVASRRVNLVKVDVTNYASSGIPLLPQHAGMGVIEAVFGAVNGIYSGANSPLLVIYSPTDQVVYLYQSTDIQVSDNTNIYTNNGSIMLLVIGA